MDPLRISSYSHMAFRVRDLERSRAFYSRLFGYAAFIDLPLKHPALAALTGGITDRAVLTMGSVGDKVIELVEYEGLPLDRIGFSHYGLRVENLDETCRRARELGAAILVEPTDIEGTRVMFIEDPDGNRLELGEFAQWPGGESAEDDASSARLVVQFFGALATRDPEKVLAMMTPEPRWEALERVFEGRSGVRERLELAAAAEPDALRRELHDVIAQGPRVAVRCTTHARTPTGEDSLDASAFFFQLRDGKVDRVHEHRDTPEGATRTSG